MKALQRPLTFVLSLVVVVSVPGRADAQYGYGSRRDAPTPNTPRLLVGTCHSAPRQLGVDASKALRQRIQNENNVRDLYVIPNADVNKALTASGYAPDSALSVSDLGALGHLVRADEILDCDASKTPNGVRVAVRMLMANDVSRAQPLPPVEARNFEDAAKVLERENTAARRQLDGYTKCHDDVLNGKPQDAIKEAQDAIQKYPQATLARLCLAAAYSDSSLHYPPDSVLAVTNAILKIDSTNTSALRLAIGAYYDNKDQAGEINAMLKLHSLEPQNQTLAGQIVDVLATTSDPSRALPILQNMLKQNPGDPHMLSQLWKLQAKLNMYKQALATGVQMVHSDSALADSAYFSRQIAMASTDSNWALVAQFAEQGANKYPKDAQFPYLGGVALRNIHQLPQAAESFRRALAIDSTNKNAQLYLAQTYSDLGQPDSVVQIADAAIAAGGDKSLWGPMLLSPVQDLVNKAKTDTANAAQYYQRALALSLHADSLSSSPTGDFFIGISAIQLAIDALRQAQPAKDCDAAKRAQTMFAYVQQYMPQGGSVDAATAGSVMNVVQKYSPVADEMVKAYCKEPAKKKRR